MESKETCTQSLDDTLGLDLATEQMFATDVKNSASSNSIPSVLRSDTQMSLVETSATDGITCKEDAQDSRIGSFVTVVEEKETPFSGNTCNADKSSKAMRAKKLDEKTFDALLADFDKMTPIPEQKSYEKQKQESVLVESYKDLGRAISVKSVRCGTVPVATLRKRLETKVLKRNKEILEEKAEIESHDPAHCPRYGKPLMCPKPHKSVRAVGISKSSPSMFNVSDSVHPVSGSNSMPIGSRLMDGKFGIKTLAAKFDVLKSKKPCEPKRSPGSSASGRFSLAVPSTSRCESQA